MATANVLSTIITNRDAVPRVLNNSSIDGGIAKRSVAVVEMVTTQDAGSTYRLFRVPSAARIESIVAFWDDMGTAGAIDVGVYQTTENGGAVVDADFFASAVVLTTANTSGTNVTHEAGTTYDIDDAEKPLWSALGLSTDPMRDYDIVATSTTAPADQGGTLTVKLAYVV